MYKLFKGQWFLYVPPGLTFEIYVFLTEYVFYDFYGSQNKQRSCPYAAETDWFL
jgi:hypothetical protein